MIAQDHLLSQRPSACFIDRIVAFAGATINRDFFHLRENKWGIDNDFDPEKKVQRNKKPLENGLFFLSHFSPK
jgi:hypothetical protein